MKKTGIYMRGDAYGYRNNHKHGLMVRFNDCNSRTNYDQQV